MDYIDALRARGVRAWALRVFEKLGCKTLQEAWDKCQSGEAMIEVLESIGYSGNTLRMIACTCVRRVLMLESTAGRKIDDRSYAVIESAWLYIQGNITTKELNAVARDAYDAIDFSKPHNPACYAARAAWYTTRNEDSGKAEHVYWTAEAKERSKTRGWNVAMLAAMDARLAVAVAGGSLEEEDKYQAVVVRSYVPKIE